MVSSCAPEVMNDAVKNSNSKAGRPEPGKGGQWEGHFNCCLVPLPNAETEGPVLKWPAKAGPCFLLSSCISYKHKLFVLLEQLKEPETKLSNYVEKSLELRVSSLTMLPAF